MPKFFLTFRVLLLLLSVFTLYLSIIINSNPGIYNIVLYNVPLVNLELFVSFVAYQNISFPLLSQVLKYNKHQYKHVTSKHVAAGSAHKNSSALLRSSKISALTSSGRGAEGPAFE